MSLGRKYKLFCFWWLAGQETMIVVVHIISCKRTFQSKLFSLGQIIREIWCFKVGNILRLSPPIKLHNPAKKGCPSDLVIFYFLLNQKHLLSGLYYTFVSLFYIAIWICGFENDVKVK